MLKIMFNLEIPYNYNRTFQKAGTFQQVKTMALHRYSDEDYSRLKSYVLKKG